MPVDRSVRLSVSQFSELIGIEPTRFVGVEVDKQTSTIVVVLEPIERDSDHGPDPTGHP